VPEEALVQKNDSSVQQKTNQRHQVPQENVLKQRKRASVGCITNIEERKGVESEEYGGGFTSIKKVKGNLDDLSGEII